MKVIRYTLWGAALIALVVAAVHQYSHFLGTDSEEVNRFQPSSRT